MRFAAVSIALALGSAILGAGTAMAQGLAIAPTTVEIDAARRNAVIRVENTSGEAVDLQFRVFDWQQSDRGDRLTPSDAVIVSPAIVAVPAGGKQVFRVLLTEPVGIGERSFRLLLDQIPRATPGTVSVAVEFSLPAFVGSGAAAARVDAAEASDGIVLRNRGSRRVKFGDLSIVSASGTTLPIAGVRGQYLLAAATRRLQLPSGAALAGARLVGTTDAGPIDVPLAALVAQR